MWSSSLCITWNIFVSSANMKMELDTTDGKSLINIKNSKGPKTDPWGLAWGEMVRFLGFGGQDGRAILALVDAELRK